MANANKSTASKTIHACIVIALMVMGFFVALPEPITAYGSQVIFIFVGLIWGWIFCDLLWPSILGITMLGLTQFSTTGVAGSIGALLSNDTVVAIIVCFIFFALISESGLLDIGMNKVITSKFTAGKPWRFIVVFLIAVGILSLAFNMIVLMLLSFAFLAKLFERMGYTKDDALPSYMFLGIGMFAGFGPMLIPYMPSALIILGLITQCLGGTPLNLGQWIVCIDLPIITTWAVYLLLGRFVFRIDITKFAEGAEILAEEKAKEGKKPMNQLQKYCFILLLLFVIFNVILGVAPKTIPVIAFLSKFGIVGIASILVVACGILHLANGEPLGNIAKMAQSGVSWTMVFLVGSIMTITRVMTTGDTGVAAAMVKWVVPLVSSMPVVVFVIVVMLVICLISQVSMNLVLSMTFAPILTPIAVAAGWNPLIAVMAVVLGTQLAFMSPSGCQMAALVYSQNDWVKMGTIQKFALPWTIISLAIWMVYTLVFPGIVS